jgi:peptide deformylase
MTCWKPCTPHPGLALRQRRSTCTSGSWSSTSAEHNDPLILINPEILSREGEIATEEGCLSVPGYFEEVKRASRIHIRAQDRDGNFFERDCEEILAVCIQHEMDHLDGKLFVDYLSSLKRERVRKKLEKDRKERATRSATTPERRSRAL